MADQDIYASIQKDAETQKKAALDALAQAGSAGLNAFNEAQAGIARQRQATIQRAAQRAALLGGPESQGFEAIATEPYSIAEGSNQALRTAFEQDLARQRAGTSDYFAKVGAAIPAERAAAASASAGDLSDSELRTRLLGTAREVRRAEEAAASEDEARVAQARAVAADRAREDNVLKQARSARTEINSRLRHEKDPRVRKALQAQHDRVQAAIINRKNELYTEAHATQQKATKRRSDEEIIRDVGSQLLPGQEALVSGLVGPGQLASEEAARERLAFGTPEPAEQAAKRLGIDTKTFRKIQANKDYKELLRDSIKRAGRGDTPWETIDNSLQNAFLLRGQDRTYRLLVAQLRPLFRTAATMVRSREAVAEERETR